MTVPWLTILPGVWLTVVIPEFPVIELVMVGVLAVFDSVTVLFMLT
jgi:hypothetical protein